jgi:soluble lytic murein transglycosylase-like protein
VQDRRSQPYAAAPYEPAAPAVWPARKVALGVASLFGVAALAVFGCSPASPARSLTLPRLELPFAASKSAAPAGVPALPGEASARPVEQVAPLAAAPAPADAPAVAPAAAEPAAMPIAAAPAVRTPWQPPDVPRRLYRREIEHWRPLVRQLIAELWSEGRMDGAASRLDDDLVLAIIQQESGGDPDAYSWAGAIGLMQVMPFTFAEMMAGDRAMADQIDPPVMFDVPSNMRAGLRYLALAMNAHEGNYYWAIASYNAGIEAVDDWRAVGLYAVPPLGGYEETANYAQVILRNYIRHRPDVAGQIHVPDPMPYEHVPGAIELLVQAGRW